MSKNKSKKLAGRARKEAREEKQAKTVINWIAGVLVVLALALAIMYAAMMG